MTTKTIPAKTLLDMGLPDNAIEDNIDDVSRWSVIHSIVFEYEDKHWKTYYSVGATEQQYEEPWQDEDTVTIIEVEKKLVEQWAAVE